MSGFASYNFRDSSYINKFVANTFEELKDSTSHVPRDQFRLDDGFAIGAYKDNEKMQQCSDKSRIKKEPIFHYDEPASSTCMPFSPMHAIFNYGEMKFHSFAISQDDDMEDRENYPPIWKYEAETTQDNQSAQDSMTSTTIQEGNTHRLLNLFEDSYSKFKTRKNKDYAQPNESTPDNPKGAIPKNKKIDSDAFQLGRQKGIREILSSMVSPISTANMAATLDSPDLSLSYLQKENVMLLNKLAENSGSLTRPSGSLTRPESYSSPIFEDTSTIYTANISKEESRVGVNSLCMESKFKHPNDKLEVEELTRIWLKPFWNTDIINKDEYKDIMLKCVRKISCWKDEDRTPVTIRRLVEFYIKKLRMETRLSRSCKKSKRSSLRSNSSNEKSESRSSIETQNVLDDVSNKKCNSDNNECSGKAANIEITIKQSCSNARKRSCCKKSSKSSSQKIVISGDKGKNIKRWRY